MDLCFQDHQRLHRAAAKAMAGGALCAALVPLLPIPDLMTVPAALTGSALALAALAEEPRVARQRRLLSALLAAPLVAALGALSGPAWAAVFSGALAGGLLSVAQAHAATERGERAPARGRIVAAACLCGAAALLAQQLLPGLGERLPLPGMAVRLFVGAASGLWVALAGAVVQVGRAADEVEQRLAALRPGLTAELRGLCERAVAARREALVALPPGAHGELRTLLSALAGAALEVAGRAAACGRAAPAAAEDELQRRKEALLQGAEAAEDAPARQSYLRAAEALEGSLELVRRAKRARERAVARLHEETAHLERARAALSALGLADAGRSAAELELLHERLQHAALPLECADDATGFLAAES